MGGRSKLNRFFRAHVFLIQNLWVFWGGPLGPKIPSIPGDLSTKLKLLGVNVASFGANAEFWKYRMYDFHDGQVGDQEMLGGSSHLVSG